MGNCVFSPEIVRQRTVKHMPAAYLDSIRGRATELESANATASSRQNRDIQQIRSAIREDLQKTTADPDRCPPRHRARCACARPSGCYNANASRSAHSARHRLTNGWRKTRLRRWQRSRCPALERQRRHPTAGGGDGDGFFLHDGRNHHRLAYARRSLGLERKAVPSHSPN